MGAHLIADVSETARWVALYRAQETERADALFRDPFAARFANDKARAVAARVPLSWRSGWPIVLRTKILDEVIAASIADGCDRVINLAAGFDTRPYRLALPAALEWVEADSAALLQEKERLLAGERPVCALRREPVDLADAGARKAFLDRATAGAKRALVVTEGLLIYLDAAVVGSLARDLASSAAVRFWVFDLPSPAVSRRTSQTLGETLRNAPFKFAPANGVAFFEALGWRERGIHSIFREAVRHGRGPLVMRALARVFRRDPDPRRLRPYDLWSAIIRLERAPG